MSATNQILTMSILAKAEEAFKSAHDFLFLKLKGFAPVKELVDNLLGAVDARKKYILKREGVRKNASSTTLCFEMNLDFISTTREKIDLENDEQLVDDPDIIRLDETVQNMECYEFISINDFLPTLFDPSSNSTYYAVAKFMESLILQTPFELLTYDTHNKFVDYIYICACVSVYGVSVYNIYI